MYKKTACYNSNYTCLVELQTITKPDKIDIEITNMRHFGVKMKIPPPFEKN